MITLRTATIKDLDLLLQWDKKHHVIESDPDDDWNWETELTKYPAWREQLVAEINGEPIGFIQLIDPYHEETHYWKDAEQNKRAITPLLVFRLDDNFCYGTSHQQLILCIAS